MAKLIEASFDIQLLPHDEIPSMHVVSILMQRLHGKLPMYEGRLGIGFMYIQNNYNAQTDKQTSPLNTIRIFGSEHDLASLHGQLIRISEFNDYAEVKRVATVPQCNEFMTYERVHVYGNSKLKRMRSRHEKRGTNHDLSDDLLKQIMQNKLKALGEKTRDPDTRYIKIQLRSYSTKQEFILLIKQRNTSEQKEGRFNSYGLGICGATVPKF